MKLKFQVIDRVGAMAQIAVVLADKDLNILAMEVEKRDGATFVYLDLETGPQSPLQEAILSSLEAIPNILSVVSIRTMPQERREKRFKVVLDSVSDGILSINEEGELTTINRVARGMLGLTDRELVGRNLRDLDFPDTSLLSCLDGRTYHNVKRSISHGNRRARFLASSQVIRDSKGRIVGAVEVLRDIKGLHEVASAVAGEPQVTFDDMVGQSPALRQAIAFAEKVAPTDGIVSIRGESGTGKELFASAIHVASGCRGPFVPVNCAALPENLLESELFGYVGGAFSGAKKEGRAGLFETAKSGTIFLDEIAEMPAALQAKMLRVIQDGKLRRIGSNEEITVNARVVTATNRDLEQLVRQGRFREDLYYRVNLFPLHIPPLRERLEDIPLLAGHFLFQVNARLGLRARQLTAGALAKLRSHHWPGNVRELRNVIERAAILSGREEIDAESIRFSFEISRPDGVAAAAGGTSLAGQVEQLERRVIAEALQLAPSKRQAAKMLGLSHTGLLKKLKKYGMG
ncbi:Fis family transcriptional regulator [Geothermobacter hydrogeniphilus]|uniref:HTH-type transcriptional regulatory protein TyrR n=1 Tax=Geothermobacter hydrogeniphilus TaxID=1969733 RepID=A0A2K2H7R9_9BACT|nr:Fis family transcriptional regulator [Geothermobacter hydrogeniphilus]